MLIVTLDTASLLDDAVLATILPFVSAYLVMNADNGFAMLYKSDFLCSTTVGQPNSLETVSVVRQKIESSVRLHRASVPSHVLEEICLSSSSSHEGSAISASLSSALCYINHCKRMYPRLQGRILCVASPVDVASHNIPLMNCVFSCQKLDVPIDAYVIGTAGSQHESVFLQQASSITQGVYLRYKGDTRMMLPEWMSVLLSSSSTRKHIFVPHAGNVDFRATCFCHQRSIETGYVCSVCLSIWCEKVASCPTCGEVFP